MNRALTILVLSLGLAGPSPAVWAKGQPRSSDGDYNVSVAGFGKGAGTASVAGAKLKIDAKVTTENGDKGTMSAADVAIVKNHFSGTGTVLGQSATFKGRLDAPDAVDEKAIKGVRLSGTVATADGKYYRLMGFIPALAQAPDDDAAPSTGGTGGTGAGGGKKDDDDDDDGGRHSRTDKNVRPKPHAWGKKK
jgi:hypothetical protein